VICEVTRLASINRAGCVTARRLLGALLPRPPLGGAAAMRRFANVICRTAKGLFDHHIGTGEHDRRLSECLAVFEIKDRRSG